ncbi:MAG: cobalt chelatase [Bacteroidales bacterium]|nr:cobalt chelatase [Bacteroidales bacterium]
MKRVFQNLVSILLFSSVILYTSCSKNEDSNDDRNPVKIAKKHDIALLLCSFGSTYEQPQVTYDSIVADYQKAFPNADIYVSFTSRTIVSRVYAKIGEAFAQPDLWLKAIGEAGYSTVYVQSLHVIPGEEYLSLMNTDVKKNFMIPFANVKVAKSACLLESEEDVEALANVLYTYYKSRLDKGEVVALMGHGNPDSEYNHANEKYDLLEAKLQTLSGKQNIFVGTVDWGDKMFSHVRDGIKAFAAKNGKTYSQVVVNLSPLMSIAGDHAQNDLLGDLEEGQTMVDVNPDEDDWEAGFSWKLKLQKLGFSISSEGTVTDPASFNVIGLGDHKAIRAIWLKHMQEAAPNAESWNEHLGE